MSYSLLHTHTPSQLTPPPSMTTPATTAHTSAHDKSPLPMVIGGPMPCEHNAWCRCRRRAKSEDAPKGVRLRCILCKQLWVADLVGDYGKCPRFYSGECDGRCGKPHVFARGSIPFHATTLERMDLCARSLRETREQCPKLKTTRRKGKGKEKGEAKKDASQATSATEG